MILIYSVVRSCFDKPVLSAVEGLSTNGFCFPREYVPARPEPVEACPERSRRGRPLMDSHQLEIG